jgi:hypothetical protein
MALEDAVQNARHTGQTITWLRNNGTPVDLTGSTLTGHIRSQLNGETRDITGTLTISAIPTSGVFVWAYSAADIATDGIFDVQFYATFPDTEKDTSYFGYWTVAEEI